jgi:hypothetical protein
VECVRAESSNGFVENNLILLVKLAFGLTEN